MRSMKKFFAITLLALLAGLYTPVALAAEGTAESPGITQAGGATVAADGTAESPGYLGTAESPGFMATVSIYLNVIL
jgi:hypothetical protein